MQNTAERVNNGSLNNAKQMTKGAIVKKSENFYISWNIKAAELIWRVGNASGKRSDTTQSERLVDNLTQIPEQAIKNKEKNLKIAKILNKKVKKMKKFFFLILKFKKNF